MFLLKENITSFIRYVGVTFAAGGTGVAAVLADDTTVPPPLLTSFYGLLSIHRWGVLYIVSSVILMVGLFHRLTARWGLFGILFLMIVRLGFQMHQAVTLWAEGATWRELLPVVGGLPILVGFVACVFSMLMEPFFYIDPGSDTVTIIRTNGDET